MKKILNEWNKYILKETSVSRVYEHMMEHDTVFISAYRGDTSDLTNCMRGASKILDNKERNKELKAAILEKRYGVTSVKGSYVEDFGTPAAREVKEHSFFVVNLEDDPEFASVLMELAEYYCQDSILFVPRGAENAELIGTNGADYPGFHRIDQMGDFFGGEQGEFMTRVGKRQRPIKFAEGLETKSKAQNNTKYLISKIGKKVLKEIADNNKK